MSSYINLYRKRKILKVVFPNFWLDGRKLLYDIKKPFEELLKGAVCLLNWAVPDCLESFALNGSAGKAQRLTVRPLLTPRSNHKYWFSSYYCQ